MKRSFKEKAVKFWEKNKKWICELACVAGGCALIALIIKSTDKKLRGNDSDGDDDYEEEDYEKFIDAEPIEKEQTFEEKLNDPSRKLSCGGWILVNWLDREYPELVANDVPVSSLGEFGQELVKLADNADLGRFEQDVAKAWTSIIISIEAPEVQEGR